MAEHNAETMGVSVAINSVEQEITTFKFSSVFENSIREIFIAYDHLNIVFSRMFIVALII